MLDDLKYIHEKDAQDALGVAEKQWEQLKKKYEVSLDGFSEPQNIVLSGMGGSAWPADYLNTWPGLNLPFEINRNYILPAYVDKKTLFIASSYSGNTEETLSALKEAEKRNAQIVIMSSGGQLEKTAQEKNHKFYKIPSGSQPRMSSFYFIAALLEIFSQLGVVDKSCLEERNSIADWLREQTLGWRPDVPSSKNPAKQLAQELMGKTVIIYSGPLMAPAAHKWKVCMTENAKNLSWDNQYPELNHNEFTGWSGHPTQKPFAIVEIRSNKELERIQQRFDVTERLLSGMRPSPNVVVPKGASVPQQLFWSSMFGDFVSIYLALLNGVNPTPVDLVEKFKKALN